MSEIFLLFLFSFIPYSLLLSLYLPTFPLCFEERVESRENVVRGDVLANRDFYSRDETFLRLLVGKLKRMDLNAKGRAPWRNDNDRCRLYHEHSDHINCGGVKEEK